MVHQVIIIDSNLKLKKGKIGRVCAFLTAQLIFYYQNYNSVSIKSLLKCVVLKTDNYNEVRNYLDNIGQNYVEHIDAGLTSVKPLTNCGLSFIYPDGIKYNLIDELKLL